MDRVDGRTTSRTRFIVLMLCQQYRRYVKWCGRTDMYRAPLLDWAKSICAQLDLDPQQVANEYEERYS